MDKFDLAVEAARIARDKAIAQAEEIYRRRIAKAETSRAEAKPSKTESILAMKRAGYSRKEIATAVEVNVSFVSFAIKQNEKIIERSKSEPAVLELSVRALNVLKRLGVETPNPRTFGRITLQQLKASENCGVKSIREIEAWMAGKGHKLL